MFSLLLDFFAAGRVKPLPYAGEKTDPASVAPTIGRRNRPYAASPSAARRYGLDANLRDVEGAVPYAGLRF